MAKVITFSRQFPAYHPRSGQPTFFVEQFWNSFNVSARGEEFLIPFQSEILNLNRHLLYRTIDAFKFSLAPRDHLGKKHHTIRAGERFKSGDVFSPRVWSGKPYNSKQIIIAPDTKIEKVFDFEMHFDKLMINGKYHCAINSPRDHSKTALANFAKNDGLHKQDLLDWFKYPAPVINNQIICWEKEVKY